MAIVAGVDFGTLSVRVSIVDSERGILASAVAEYPLHRKADDPDHATQSHADHMQALATATRKALADAGVAGTAVEAIAIDTTGSSVIPVDAGLQPLDDYYLWCDHRAWEEAAQITDTARRQGQRVIFIRDLLDTLRRRELDTAGAKISAETGLPYHSAAESESIAGVYRQRLSLASGRFAMIDDGLGFNLVPWTPSLERQRGRQVFGSVRSSGMIDWSFGRQLGLGP